MAAARLTSTDWLRDSTGHPADAWFDPVAADEVRSMITTFAPDAVVLGGFAVHPYGAVVAETGVPVILDHQNVEADLAEETAALAAPAPHVMVRRLAEVYVGPGVRFPPMDEPPPGHVIRITPTRIGGVGPWG